MWLRVRREKKGSSGSPAKIEDDPERLKKSITFAGQVFKESWIVSKARYCSFLREHGSTRVYKRLQDEMHLSLNDLVRLEGP